MGSLDYWYNHYQIATQTDLRWRAGYAGLARAALLLVLVVSTMQIWDLPTGAQDIVQDLLIIAILAIDGSGAGGRRRWQWHSAPAGRAGTGASHPATTSAIGKSMTPGSAPIRRRKLADDVQERLLSLIRTQGLQPGAALPSERELMAEYQVGRPAIREAMQSLQRMGLIEIKHGERPRVAQPSMETLIEQASETMHHLLAHSASAMDHLKEARILFEGQMARIAAERRTPSDIDRLKTILARQEALRAEPSGFLAHDGMFHRAIASTAGNPLFELVSQAMFNWLALFRVDMVRKPGLEALTLTEHRAILEAIVAGDADAAQERMTAHLMRANTLYHQDNAQPAPAGEAT